MAAAAAGAGSMPLFRRCAPTRENPQTTVPGGESPPAASRRRPIIRALKSAFFTLYHSSVSNGVLFLCSLMQIWRVSNETCRDNVLHCILQYMSKYVQSFYTIQNILQLSLLFLYDTMIYA